MSGARVAVLAAGLGLGACLCPTIWFSARRDAGAPPVASASAVDLESRPIGVPLRLDNRFDLVGDPTRIPLAVHGFQDTIDPTNDAVNERQRIVDATRALLAATEVEGGVPYAAATPEQLARVSCPLDACTGLTVTGDRAARPAYAQVSYQGQSWVRPIEGWELHEDAAADGVDAGAGDDGGGARRIYVRLAEPLPAPIADGVEVAVTFGDLRGPEPFLTFVHLSDAQIRDPVLKLGDRELSARLDRIIPSFEQDEDQARHGAQLVQAVVARINSEVMAHRDDGVGARPRFVLHTGDSVDAGTFRELDMFIEIMDRLTVPWFNALGNHDVLVFGNMLSVASDSDSDGSCVSLQSVAAPYPVPAKRSSWFYPARVCIDETIEGEVGRRDQFIAGKDHAASRRAFIAAHGPAAATAWMLPPARPADVYTPECLKVFGRSTSRYHGFDLYSHAKADALDRGYYAFATDTELALPDRTTRNAIFIVLNTEDLDAAQGGNAGRVDDTQLQWLKTAVGCARSTDLVFIAGHHQLSEIELSDKRRLREDAVLQSPNIVAYLYGHKHEHGLCRDDGACGQEFRGVKTHFWELETGSLLERPQEGRLIRLKYVAGDLAFIETVVFSEGLVDRSTAFAREVELAVRGAARDKCLLPGTTCSADGRVRRGDGPHTNARLFFRLPK